MVDKDKRAAREVAARDGIPYARALRQVRQQPRPPIPPQALAALQADPAAGYAEDDWSWDARHARGQAQKLAYWRRRQQDREVRLWEAVIEVRCLAVSDDEAWWRIALGYMRTPIYRAEGMSCFTQELHDEPEDGYREVAVVEVDQLADGEWERLLQDYPRRPVPWPSTWSSRGPEKAHDIAGYAAALRRAAARAAGGDVDEPALAPLPPELVARLQVWRAVHTAEFLAGVSIDDARIRAAELAATIVDVHGRPLARVLEVRPDDGFAGKDGQWLHPVMWSGSVESAESLWDDYEAAGTAAADPARLLHAEADRLDQQWRAENAEIAAFGARLHTQPDGSRTLSTVEEIDDVRQLVMRRWRDKPVAEIRERAEHWRYMADRVYGKVVNTDEDAKRVEQADAMAKALTAMADEREQPAPATRRQPPPLTDELVWLSPAEVDPGDEEAGLVWRGADAADYAARLEDAVADDQDRR